MDRDIYHGKEMKTDIDILGAHSSRTSSTVPRIPVVRRLCPPADRERLAHFVSLDREIRRSANPLKRSRLTERAGELLALMGIDPQLPDHDLRIAAITGEATLDAVRRRIGKPATALPTTSAQITTKLLADALPAAAGGSVLIVTGSTAFGVVDPVSGLIGAVSGGIVASKLAVIDDEVADKASKQDADRRKTEAASRRSLDFGGWVALFKGIRPQGRVCGRCNDSRSRKRGPRMFRRPA